jgi:TRAP-type mannitol/chloroaromatic compound transport system substrate-binding protein
VLAAGMAPAVHAQPTVRWRLASSFPKSLDTIHGGAEVFAQKVRQLSSGRFEISVHAAGELMPAFAVVDGVQHGTIECAHTAPYYFFDKDETFAIGGAIPFGLNSRQMSAWTFQGNGLKLMREFYANYGIISFPCGNTGAQMGGWMRKEIRSVADLKGLKFRIGGFAGKVLERMGGVPQNIPGGDIYQALEKGSIDAAEWIGPYDDEKLGFNRVAPFYYYPGWWEGGLNLSFYVNQTKFNELPQVYKDALESACRDSTIETMAKYDVQNPQALRRLIGAGTQLRAFPREVMQACYKAAFELYDETAAKNASFKKVYEPWKAFRDTEYQWFRVAESTFDNFVYFMHAQEQRR